MAWFPGSRRRVNLFRDIRQGRASIDEAQDEYEQKEKKERPGDFHMFVCQKEISFSINIRLKLLSGTFILRLNNIPLIFPENILLILWSFH